MHCSCAGACPSVLGILNPNIRMKHQLQAPNPVLNVPRRNEDVVTDTLYSNTPAIDDGSTACQYFQGKTSKYRSVVPLGKSDAQYPMALLEEI